MVRGRSASGSPSSLVTAARAATMRSAPRRSPSSVIASSTSGKALLSTDRRGKIKAIAICTGGGVHESRRRLPLRPHPLRGRGRPRQGRDLPLHGLPDAVGLGLPHRRADERGHLQAAVGRAQGLRQDRRERQQAGADVLPGLRLADLLGARGGRRQGGRPARRHHPPARPAGPERPVLVPLGAGLARATCRAIGKREKQPVFDPKGGFGR